MRVIATILAVGATVLALAPAARAQPAPPAAIAESLTVPGLTAPGEIVVDHWGITHIYGASAHDAFFLQGFNAARDRLWQIDLWRKHGLGRLSASFGAQFIEKDRAARLLLYRGDMAAEWASYPADAHGWTQAFVDGINAYVGEVKAGRRPLPPEFALTGSQPETWSADDVVRIRLHALVGNLPAEVLRAQSICHGGLKVETLRHKIEPRHTITVPKGLDPCDVDSGVLRDYLLATQAVAFDGKRMVAEAPDAKMLAQRNDEITQEGSNNWVVAASHSATGRPILANDPHREHSVPSLRYLVHLDAPDLHLIGAGEPALPGISFGHNDVSAWGLTIFYVDQQDLYVYELSPDHPLSYRYKGGWEPMQVVHERLEVKGEADRDVELRFTRHGPVIAQDDGHHRAYAVRSIWNLPGGAGYFNAAWMFKASSWADFQTTHAHWGGPPLNLVYADTHGDIGWLPSAYAPVRPNWDGLVPVPGDGRYEWKGLTRPDDFPGVKNPAQGWFATANEMNLPKDYPSETRKLGFEWVDRSRIDEIQSQLRAKDKLDLTDMMRIQTDQHSPLARETAGLLAGLTGQDADQTAALALLKGWDGTETASSPQAALYEVWVARHLRKAAVEALVPEAARAVFNDPQLAAVTDWLSHPDARFGANPKAARDRILLTSLGEAWRDVAGQLGPNPSKWRWGALHHAQFTPAVAAVATPEYKAQLSVGPLEVGGSASTPMATTYRPNDFNVVAGASVRMVLDVGAWDNSVVINTPGQSGDPSSPHYRDLFPIWAAGGYAPLLYSRAAVMANAERVIALTPGR
jgi:penicillin amidase